MTNFIWLPIIPMTIILGLIQLFFIHKDVSVRFGHWFVHGFHIIFLMPIFLFVVFNVEAAFNLVGLSTTAWYSNVIFVRAVVALVFGIKGSLLSKAMKGAGGSTPGMHESFLHTLLMMALVFAAPWVWPMVQPMLPAWAGGNN